MRESLSSDLYNPPLSQPAPEAFPLSLSYRVDSLRGGVSLDSLHDHARHQQGHQMVLIKLGCLYGEGGEKSGVAPQ